MPFGEIRHGSIALWAKMKNVLCGGAIERQRYSASATASGAGSRGSRRKESDMRRTGVFATAEEVQALKQPHPAMKIGESEGETPQEHAHRLALHHGLPDVLGYYGCDLRTG